MANNAVICGVVVDRKDYDGFALQEFEVPHDFKEGKRKLDAIEFFAKCDDYKKHYPEFAEECRKIVEREKRNIQRFYARKDGRKEYVAMRHDNFTEYLRDLQGIQRAAAKERREMKARRDRAEAKWKEAQKDPALTELEKTSRKMEWLQAKESYEKGLADLRRRADADVKVVREEFHRHIDDFYSANGDRIDDGAVRLLQSGIKLSDREINRLVESNLSNPTMLRIISDHCDRNKIDNKAARFYGVCARGAGKSEKDAFEQIVGMIDRAVGTDEAIAEAWGRENSHFDELSNKAVEGVASLAVHPEAAE